MPNDQTTVRGSVEREAIAANVQIEAGLQNVRRCLLRIEHGVKG